MIKGIGTVEVVNDQGVRAFPYEEEVHLVPNVTRVRAATAAGLAACTLAGNVLTATADGAIGAIDTSVTLAAGDLLLVKNQAAGLQNGVYEILSVGGTSAKWSMRRAAGWDASARVKAMRLVAVSEGTANGNTVFAMTTDDPIVLNTTALVFAAATAAALGAGDVTPAMLSAAVHSGSCTLEAGTVDVADTAITADSKIAVTRTAPGGTTTDTVSYDVVSKAAGVGFTVQACVAAGTINVADESDLDYVVVESP